MKHVNCKKKMKSREITRNHAGKVREQFEKSKKKTLQYVRKIASPKFENFCSRLFESEITPSHAKSREATVVK